MKIRSSLCALLALVVIAGCGAAPDAAVVSEALGNGYDHPFWRDPNFPGSTREGDGWYDSDVPWARGSFVRLPVDSQYVGNRWSPVNCQGGGHATMNSPVFQATVHGVTRQYTINHMIQDQFFIPWQADHQTYNGGALIGLSGGTLCNEGFPTYSTGNHFCNEVDGEDPYLFWNGSASYSSSTWLPSYTSGCGGSDGSSGQTNPACAGPVCGTRHCAPGDWCGSGNKCCSGCSAGCPC